MSFIKSDFESIDDRLKQIVTQSVETIDVTNETPPTLDNLLDSNKAYSLYAAILFTDIRKSTYLTENSQAKSMVKLYRSFMRMSVSCVRKCGGVTRQFLGDRIMGIFLDTINDEGQVTISAVDKAVECARAMQTALDHSLNRVLKHNLNNKVISCGIGIDYGRVLLTKVGMYGVESDESKENETNCVWVGSATNKASKHSDLAQGGEIFISEQTFNKLSSALKPEGIWSNVAKNKSQSIFKGYIAKNFYLDIVDGISPIQADSDNDSNEDGYCIAEGLNQIDKVQTKLNQKEVDLKVLEKHLKHEKDLVKEDREQNNQEEAKLDNAKKVHETSILSFYNLLKSYVDRSFYDEKLLLAIGLESWQKMISDLYTLGNQLGMTRRELTSEMDCELVGIYDHFGLFESAYEAMIVMAEDNLRWVNIKEGTLLWAKKNSIVHRLRDAIEAKINDYSKNVDRDDYRERLKEIKKIVGY